MIEVTRPNRPWGTTLSAVATVTALAMFMIFASVAAGASDPAESVRRIEGGITYGVLSMDSFGFGLDEADAAKSRAA